MILCMKPAGGSIAVQQRVFKSQKKNEKLPKKKKTSMAGNISNSASSLSKLQSLNGLFAIYKKQGPTSADVLNALKEVLLKGKSRVYGGTATRNMSVDIDWS